LNDVISGGLLGHLGSLYLALGPNRWMVVFRWSLYWKLGDVLLLSARWPNRTCKIWNVNHFSSWFSTSKYPFVGSWCL